MTPSAAVTVTVIVFDPSASDTVRVVPAVLPSASAMTTPAPASLGVAVTVVAVTPLTT